MSEESPHNVVANELDCDIRVSKFKLHSHYYTHIQVKALRGKYEPPSEAVCIPHSANTHGKSMNLSILPIIMDQTGFFNVGMATNLGEGKLWIQTRPIEKWALWGYSCSKCMTWAVLPWTNQEGEVQLK